jgi:EmrB/QacA subfamily drug resistance transporter
MEKQMTKTKIALILAGVMASLLMSSLDSTIVSTAMKSIAGNLGGMQFYSWPFTIYMLCSTLSVLVCGGLADIYGHKPMFLIGIVIFLTGSVLCGMSQSMMQLIAFRGLQGIGGGIIVSSVFTVIADMFEPAQRGKYTGIVTAMYGLSSIIGPLAGGFITDTLGWRWIFFVNLPLGILAIAIVAVTMPGFKSGDTKKPVDYAGIAALILSLVPMLLAVSMAGKNFAWVSVPCISMFLFSAIMMAVFVFLEKRSPNPMLPLTFFKDRAISVSFLIAFFSQALMFSAIMYLPYFVQGVIGSTATTSGAVITPMMLGLLLSSNLTGQFVSRIGKAKLLSVSAFVLMGAGALLLSTMGVGTSYSMAILFMVILGLGVGMTMPITNVNAQNAAPKQQIGSVTSTVMFFRNIGSTIGSAIYGVIMTNSLSNGFSGLNMQHLPEKIQEMLKNIQILTNAQTIATIRSHVPKLYLNYFDTVYLQAKGVLANSIHDVFLFCIGIAVIGFVCALFLREAPVAKSKKAAVADYSITGQKAAH